MPLNFYQLYKLLNENTVSQELGRLKKTNDEIAAYIEKMYKGYLQPLSRVFPTISVKSRETLAKWLVHNMSSVRNKKFDKEAENYSLLGPWAEQLRDMAGDYLISKTDDNGNFQAFLIAKLNDPKFSFKDLEDLSDQYHEDIKKGKIKIPGSKDGKIILSFPDGYKWVHLDRGHCAIEGVAGKHCGNVNAKPGDTILSLRDKKNYVHLTFILNKGKLEERKAKANTKPKQEHHHHIIELLKLPIIKSLGKGRYLPERDFKLSDLSESDLEDLIKNKPILRQSLSLERLYNNTATSEDLNFLSDHEDWTIRQLVADNKNTPSETLDKLIKDSETGVLVSLAKNPNTNTETLEILSNDKKFEVRAVVASNKNTPIRTLEKLMNDDSASVRAVVASNKNTPIRTLEKLMNDDSASVMLYAVRNEKANKEILEKFAPVLLQKYKSGFFNDSLYKLNSIVDVLLERRVDTEILEELIEIQNDQLREKIAKKTNSLKILERLTELIFEQFTADGIKTLLRIIENNNVSTELLDKIFDHVERPRSTWHNISSSVSLTSIARAFIENEKTSKDVVIRLVDKSLGSKYSTGLGHCQLAMNIYSSVPHANSEILDFLAKKGGREVRSSVANNPNTSPGTLSVLANDARRAVRKNVASNPNTKKEDLEKLLQDPKKDVRDLAKRNLDRI